MRDLNLFLVLCWALGQGEAKPELRIEAEAHLKVDIPLAQSLAFFCSPQGLCYIQLMRQSPEGAWLRSVQELTLDGKLGKSHELVGSGMSRVVIDSKGRLMTRAVSRDDHGLEFPEICIMSSDSRCEEKVRLRRQFQAYQFLRTADGDWIVGGWEGGNSTTTSPGRQAIFRFRSNGEFAGEFDLSPKNPGGGGDAVRSANLSYLLEDGAGNFYLVTPSSSPIVTKFDSSGRLLSQVKLPYFARSAVLNTILNDKGQLVIDRVTLAGQPGNDGPPARRLTTVEPTTLEIVEHALCPPDYGRLGTIKNGQYFFLKIHPTAGIQLIRARAN